MKALLISIATLLLLGTGAKGHRTPVTLDVTDVSCSTVTLRVPVTGDSLRLYYEVYDGKRKVEQKYILMLAKGGVYVSPSREGIELIKDMLRCDRVTMWVEEDK